MPRFQRGETIICWRNVKNIDTGEYIDPSSMRIQIKNSKNEIAAEEQDMHREDIGHYSYDFNTRASMPAGKYRAIYTATDGIRVTIETDNFGII